MPSINDSKCILITGATSGIGRALAVAITKLPTNPHVIGTGRRPDRLKELRSVDVEPVQLELDADADTLKKNVLDLVQKFPDLDTIILNAGIQREYDFLNTDVDLANIYQEMNVNYLSILTVIAAVLPHFKTLAATGRPCMIVNVTSGLAVVPATHLSNYSASKAALHSMTMSLQSQFQGTNIHFIEVVPPLVESELHDHEGTTEKLSKFWMPLDQYVALTLEGLQKGEPHVSCGAAAAAFDRFEKEKYDLAMKKALPTAPMNFKP
ncbi:hypothetical protein AAF712_005357 [Marasmius tenuissimus]|uniref:NAD(P)-binding protein n=1 Tax=Marasmius tenuissimus TaxID=585030 RepID=A0ABR3A2S0_9AGAR